MAPQNEIIRKQEKMSDSWYRNNKIVVIGATVAVASVALFSVIAGGWRQGKNPFVQDARRTPDELEHDKRKRDAALKNGYTHQKAMTVAGNEGLDTIVIGSGIGGLNCAALLSKAGQRVLVLEQHDQIGGCCHTFFEKGIEFDTGIHYLGELRHHTGFKFMLDQISDGQLQWVPLEDDYDCVVIGDPSKGEEVKKYPIMTGREEFISNLLQHFPSPEDSQSISKYMALLAEVRKEMLGFVGLKFMPAWMGRVLIHTGLLKFFTKFFTYANRTLHDVLMEVAPHNADLRAVLSYCFGDYGTLPKDASFAMHGVIVNHFLKGVAYPRGGSSEIAFNIVPTILRAGGACMVRASVRRILLDASGKKAVGVVMAKDGKEIRARCVVSAAGIYNTFDRLLPVLSSSSVTSSPHKDKVQHGWGGMSVFIGLKGSSVNLGIKASNTWAFLSSDLDGDARDYLQREGSECGKKEVPLLFISFPSTKDPTFAERFPGTSTCQIITLASFDWFSQWKDGRVMHRGKEYEERKNEMGRMMWKQCLALYPQLEGKDIYFNVGTPLSNLYYLGAQGGEMYGCDHNVERFSAESTVALRPETHIESLYLAGQDIFTCGFAGAAFGGLLCASKVLNRNLYADLMTLHKTSPRNI